MREERRRALDPAVAALVTEGERRQRRRQLPQARQVKARKDAARERAIYDIPQALQATIAAVADKEGVSASCIVALLLADGLRRYQGGIVSFYGLKRRSRSPRYEWTIEQSVVTDVLQGTTSLENRQVWR